MRWPIIVPLLLFSVAAIAQDSVRTESDILGRIELLNDQAEQSRSPNMTPQTARDVVTTMFNGFDQRVLRADSIADVRALDLDVSAISDGAIVFVSGYYAAGDHDGVTYRYDADSSLADTAGTVLAPDSGAGRWLIVYPNRGKVDVRFFGAQVTTVGNSCTGQFDNKDAFARAVTAEVQLYFPAGNDLEWPNWLPYCTSETLSITRGFEGDDLETSAIKAMSGFAGDVDVNGNNFMVDLFTVKRSNQRFANIAVVGNADVDSIFSSSDTVGVSHEGAHLFDRLWLTSTDGYLIDIPTCSGGPLTGATFINMVLQGGNGGELLRVLKNCGDQMTWISSRWSITAPDAVPVVIESFGATFIETFYSVGNGLTAGMSDKTLIQVSGEPHTFIGLSLENGGGLNVSNVEYIFSISPGESSRLYVSDLSYGGGDPIAGAKAIFKDTISGSGYGGQISVDRLTNGGGTKWVFPCIFEANNDSGRTDAIWGLAIENADIFGFDQLVCTTSTTASGNMPSVHITGASWGITLDHYASMDSSLNVTIKHAKPTIVANDNQNVVAASEDTSRFRAPFDGYIQDAFSILNNVLTTGDASLSVTVTGDTTSGASEVVWSTKTWQITQAGSAVGDIDTVTVAASVDSAFRRGDLITVTTTILSSNDNLDSTAAIELHLAPTGTQ